MKLLTTFSIVLALMFTGCESHTNESQDHDDGAAAELQAKKQTSVDNYISQWNSGDKDMLKSAITEGFTRVVNGEIVATGFEEMSEAADFFRDGFPDLKVVIDYSHFHNGNWYSHWTASGTNTAEFNGQPATGKPMKVTGMTEAFFNDEGLLLKEVAYWDMLTFMSQLGYELCMPEAAVDGE